MDNKIQTNASRNKCSLYIEATFVHQFLKIIIIILVSHKSL